jgi:Ca2+-transporting ATPase
MAFLAIGFGQLCIVFAMRPGSEWPWSSQVTRNPWVWAALPFSGALMLGGVAIGPASVLLSLPAPRTWDWVAATLGALTPLAAIEIARALRRGRRS